MWTTWESAKNSGRIRPPRPSIRAPGGFTFIREGRELFAVPVDPSTVPASSELDLSNFPAHDTASVVRGSDIGGKTPTLTCPSGDRSTQQVSYISKKRVRLVRFLYIPSFRCRLWNRTWESGTCSGMNPRANFRLRLLVPVLSNFVLILNLLLTLMEMEASELASSSEKYLMIGRHHEKSKISEC